MFLTTKNMKKQQFRTKNIKYFSNCKKIFKNRLKSCFLFDRMAEPKTKKEDLDYGKNNLV